MSTAARRVRPVWAVAVVFFVFFSRPVHAYSVLGHEAMVDAFWTTAIAPLLRARFPRITAEQVAAARAYAYGGSVIQDLGYYPFGSKLFTNLVHYVRSGDFVEALLRESRDPNEYAFALGALAHYASDNSGHPLGVNRTVPILYPKLRTRFGDAVLYAESPARHIMVEFAFDVLYAGTGSYASQAYRDFIGFEVAKPLLARAFRETYGLDLDDLFVSEDLAIGTYRRAVSTVIPEVTRLAWEDRQDEIRKRMPGIDRGGFVVAFSKHDFEKAYGTTYKKPGILSRIVFLLLKAVPKIGPLRPLAFKPLTPEAARLMETSFVAARERYGALLGTVAKRRLDSSRGSLTVMNTDLDTGKAPARTSNPLVEKTYADLVNKLAGRHFAGVPAALRDDIVHHYNTPTDGSLSRKERKQDRKARGQLESMLTVTGR